MSKRILTIAMALMMVFALAACGAGDGPTEPISDSATPPAGDTGAAAPAQTTTVAAATPAADIVFKESPLLAEKVATGELPPVEDRLPEEPYVSSAPEIGKYGGIYRGAGFGPTHGQLDTKALRTVGLLRVEPDLTTFVPFALKDYTVNDDYTVYTMTLRKGMKWSDGEPFTSEDFVFWYEDVLLNEEITPAIPNMWKTGDDVMKLEALDEVTVKVTFAASYPAFDIIMMKVNRMYSPKHYMQQWHIKYNPDANDLAKSEGHETWSQAFTAHNDRGQAGLDTNAPDITPWVLSKIDEQGNKYHDRNPYYFVVDREGNQLPYIDQQITVIVSDAQMRTLKLISGEIHAAAENPLPVKDYTLYKDGEAQGNYTTYMFNNTRGSDCSFTFNLTHKDPVLREIFNTVKFREAMSLAIDRDQINQVLYFGRAVARQAVPPDNTSFIEDWMINYKTEYDVDAANALLDEIGLEWDSAHTTRMRPDGKPLQIVLESIEEFAPMGEMVAEMWTAVGVKTDFKQQERSFARERFQANERDAQCFTFDSVAEFALRANAMDKIRPPWAGDELGFASEYRAWFNTNGASGTEPPQEIKDLQKMCDDWKSLSPGSPEYLELGTEILKIHTENLWYIGLTVAPRVVIISNTLGNTPTEGTFAGDYSFWYPYRGDSWYFK